MSSSTVHNVEVPPSARLNRSQRMLALLARLRERDTISLADLAAELGVSAATMRRDVAELEEQRLLRRTHGGVAAVESALELPMALRNTRVPEAKVLIARGAAQLVAPGRQVVALSGGTTTLETARALANRRQLTIVTNSLTAASEVGRHPHLQVIMTGGVMRPHSFELVGALAEHTFTAVNIGTAFLGVDGISATTGATTHDETEARTNRAMVAQAHRTVVVADGAKIGAVTVASIVPATDIDDLVTDASADPVEVQKLRDLGIRVHVMTAAMR
ncbi:DeoR/GlpR family DNA-binding transcription regulator [Microbacterium sp.]|uniref:DeoR/GlpR family DNA-binding transcription regulator n=1 Tax=Microbacterium sp. TaxID=51671 RepID=UPI003A89CCC9